VTGEVMADVFGEWRRAASPCGGALVLWLRDLAPGAGWGVIDHAGTAKVAYHHLRRALAPVAVWTTDEGLGGIHAHVANDRPTPLHARLRVAMYRDLEHRTEQAQEIIELDPHSSQRRDLEALLGHFVDASWAYRFGPPGQDVIVTSLERADEDSTPAGSDQADGSEMISQSIRFPAGRPLTVEPSDRLGLNATASVQSDGIERLQVSTRRLAYGVRIHAPGFLTSDNAFSVEPGGVRSIDLYPQRPGVMFNEGTITALNLQGRQRITPGESTS
jgi:beta-mannosidase